MQTKRNVAALAKRKTRKAGAVIGSRYRLLSRLGEGGFSEVWEAEDLVGGGRVAVKRLFERHSSTPTRIRSEIFILRLHQIPGVVRLLDEGVSEGTPYIVMELLRGEAFPGEGRSRSWPAIAGTTVALVETLARLHAQGVVHMDLKPQNVLVDADGKPTILDFGIASDPRIAARTDVGYLTGTVPFIAPELLRGQGATPLSDLYSLGVLLFYALTGAVPHAGKRTQDIIRACKTRPAPSLRSRAPDVPAAIVGLVDLLLSMDPAQRPSSALAVRGMLLGHPTTYVVEPPLLRLGGNETVEETVRRLRARQAVDIVGPRRTGRSRCLDEVKAALEREGRHAVMIRPSPHAFASLAPIVGGLDDLWSAPLVEVVDRVEARLRAALHEGTVVLADDVERMDPHSRAALDRCRDAGALVRVFDEATWQRGDATSVVRTAPLDAAALEALFGGPERLFHLRSSAARLLLARTDGIQERVAAELQEWMRAGIVTWDGVNLVVARDMLERLDVRAFSPSLGPNCLLLMAEPLPSGLDEQLAWLSLAWPDGTAQLLSSCTRQPVWQVEAQLEELVRRGAARRRPDGAFEPLSVSSSGEWSGERRRLAHRAIAQALPASAPRRFFHLSAALGDRTTTEDLTALAAEAVALARRLAHEGDLARPMSMLQAALSQIRRPLPEPDAPLVEAEARLLATLLDLALADGTAIVVGKVQYEIGRARGQTPLVAQLDQLAHAAIAFAAGGDRALRLVDAMAPFDDLDLERRRQGLRALAARRCSREIEDATLADVARWGRCAGDPLTRARLALWEGFWHYRRGRYADAARRHAEAATLDPWRIGRISARVATASALMEDFALDEALTWAKQAKEDSLGCGSPYIEARAEWILRAVLYRRGEACTPDLELVEALALLGVYDIEATACLTEAAFAYRHGDMESARRVANRAADLWKFVNDPAPSMLARCLALAAGSAPASAGEIEDLGHRGRTCAVRGIGIQALGLLARASKLAPRDVERDLPALVADIPRARWDVRMDVLSVAEAFESLGARSGHPASAS